MIEVLKWLALSFIGLIGAYILVRIITRAAFMSWFETKKEQETKNNKEI